MANQTAKKDDNHISGLLVQDSTGAETRQVRSTEANPNAIPVEVVSSGAGSIADGADVNAGSTTDAANTTGTTGTMSGKLRGIVTILANVWDSVNGLVKVSLGNALDEDVDSTTSYIKGYTAVKLSADGVVSAVSCVLGGYYVESSTTGVISLYDNASAASGNTMLASSKTVAANDVVILSTPVLMSNGVYFDLVSGSATVYVLTRKVTAQ